MPADHDPLERLARELSGLPGVGRRSATRLAFHLLKDGPGRARRLSAALEAACAGVRACETCGNLGAASPCAICTDPARDAASLMVVEEVADLRAIEETGEYRGRYHVLGGVLSPMAGVGPERLRIDALLGRLAGVRELIVALNPTVEGDSTGLFLARVVGRGVERITRLGTGLPMGGELEFQDRWTLARALESRVDVGLRVAAGGER